MFKNRLNEQYKTVKFTVPALLILFKNKKNKS